MVPCEQQVLAKDELATASSSAPSGKCSARRKASMLTCLNVQFKASGHCVAHSTVSEASTPRGCQEE